MRGEGQLRGGIGAPGIALEAVGLDFAGEVAAKEAEGVDIELQVERAEGLDVLHGEGEEADGGMESAAVLRMMRAEVLLLQVDEGAGHLDEAFVELGVRILAAEPEMLEDVVGLIVLGGIEAGEIAEVFGREVSGGAGEPGHEGGDALTFFHRADGSGVTILPGFVPDKKRLLVCRTFSLRLMARAL